MSLIDLEQIQDKLDYRFSNVKLLQQAFTHSSYANANGIADNERMEFLGDAILDMIVAEYFYNKYPSYDQGELTNVRKCIVSQDGLRPVVEQMQIVNYLKVTSKSQVKQKSDKLESNLYEAVLCAIYLDGGFDKAKEFVLRTLGEVLIDASVCQLKDNKTFVQEYCQDKKHKYSFKYVLVNKSGTDDSPIYQSALYVNNKQVAIGCGNSKKASEQDAAGIFRSTLEK